MSTDSLNILNNPDATPDARVEAACMRSKQMQPEMDAVCEVDLHIHSFYSDGYHSPAGRVFEAWRRKMKAISLTDHDTFDGVEEAVHTGRALGIDVVPGIEFYTDRPGIEIIAYWPLTDAFLNWLHQDGGREVIDPIRNAKKKQLEAMMARVPSCMKRRGLDAEITDNDIRKYVRGGVSTKGDISVIMWQKYGAELASGGISTDVKDFQARYTTQDAELNVPLDLAMDLSPEAFVRRVRAWGGLPGISHPMELRKKEGLGNDALRQILDALHAKGLQTFEVDGWRAGVCPETGLYQTDLFAQMLDACNQAHPDRLPLLPTNGSDDHNQPGEGLELGCGRNRNLRPEWGTYARVTALRDRARLLQSQQNSS